MKLCRNCWAARIQDPSQDNRNQYAIAALAGLDTMTASLQECDFYLREEHPKATKYVLDDLPKSALDTGQGRE